MQNLLIELRVGEAIQVGQYTVRLVDIVGDELCVEVEEQRGDDGLDGIFSQPEWSSEYSLTSC